MYSVQCSFVLQFRRKEAQKCYCEAENCRGWIGEEPDSDDEDVEEEEDEDEDEVEEESEEEANKIEDEEIPSAIEFGVKSELTVDDELIEPTDVSQEDSNEMLKVNEKPTVPSKKPSPTKKMRKPKLDQKQKKFKIKKSEIMVDPDLDHEIASLMETNLKNQAHTLRFSRLMVRAKTLDARSKLLSILRQGQLACRRLFLDYHGLKLLHTWMCDPVTNNVQQEWAFRLDILETLEVLPIPNKNMLQDSKVLVTVQKWASTKNIKENVKSPQESPSDSGSGTPISDSAEVNSPQVENSTIVIALKSEIIEQSIVYDGVIDASLTEVVNSSQDAIEVNDYLKEVADSSKEAVDPSEEVTNSPKDIADLSDEVKDSNKDSVKEVTDSLKDVADSSKEITDSSKEVDSIVEVNKVLEVIDSVDKKNSEVEQTQLKTGEECADDELMEQIHYLTAKLLESWEQLKEVFRIPKKLRIEQMKEHEQEANRSYRAFGITDSEDSNKRYSDPSKTKDKAFFKKEMRGRPKDLNDPETVFLKVQRRRLFEAQVIDLLKHN